MGNLLPSYAIDVNNDFVLIKGKELAQLLGSDESAHTHNFYILSFLYEGTISHLSDFSRTEISAPAVLLLDIDQVHTHPDMSHCEIISIVFSTSFIANQTNHFLKKVALLFSKPYMQVSFTELEELDNIIKIISQEIKKENPYDELLRSLLNVLIVLCCGISNKQLLFDQEDDRIYNSFIILLKKKYKDQHKVKFYADELNITTKKLNSVIKKSTLKSPKQLIDQCLLLEAKRLLYWCKAPVKEVAWELGFETDSYFNHFFKKHIGKTPKEFKVNSNLNNKNSCQPVN